LRNSFYLLRRASFAVFVANVLRATALFCIETNLLPSPAWAHEGVGLVLFGGAAVAIYYASKTQGAPSGRALPSRQRGEGTPPTSNIPEAC
jgi:exosortase/archaeosortase family protein